MGAAAWDERYACEPGLWGSATPTVVDVVEKLPPGLAVDLACGNGRDAAWLAAQGWQVQAVDFSPVGIEQARRHPGLDASRVEWTVADVAAWEPDAHFDLVLIAYLHTTDLADILRRSVGWLTATGTLVYLGHARENIEYGVGGPQDPSLLPTIEQTAAALNRTRVHRLEHLDRETDDGTAI